MSCETRRISYGVAKGLFDRYTMLALPGMDYPAVENYAHYGRDLVSLSVREVAAGRAPLDGEMTMDMFWYETFNSSLVPDRE